MKQNNPSIFLQEYELPDDSLYPQTVGGLIDILLDTQSLNEKHNIDKQSIKILTE